MNRQEGGRFSVPALDSETVDFFFSVLQTSSAPLSPFLSFSLPFPPPPPSLFPFAVESRSVATALASDSMHSYVDLLRDAGVVDAAAAAVAAAEDIYLRSLLMLYGLYSSLLCLQRA